MPIESNDDYLRRFVFGASFADQLTAQKVLAEWLKIPVAESKSSPLTRLIQGDDNPFATNIETIRKELRDLRKELEKSKAREDNYKKLTKEFGSKFENLETATLMSFVWDRIKTSAQQHLVSSKTFQKQFLPHQRHNSFVMSVDIRRSTELMLKSRTPEAFAIFITQICTDFREIVTKNYGIFDKFTGDGILAFFPDFYSGPDSFYHVIASADECHKSFQQRYDNSRSTFTSVLASVGLGIGIDYGDIHLVNISDGLTGVGHPVVYACRLAGAPAGTTLLNQSAYNKIIRDRQDIFRINETKLNIKHEGEIIAYDVKLSQRNFEPKAPEWEISPIVNNPGALSSASDQDGDSAR